MVSDPCMHLTRPILFDSHPSTSSLARSVLLGRVHLLLMVHVTMRCVLSNSRASTTTTVARCIPTYCKQLAGKTTPGYSSTNIW